MNTKGSMVLMVILELLIVVSIVGLSMTFARQLSESSVIMKRNVANDLSLMVDTVLGLPGNIVVEYPADVSNYTITIEGEELRVEDLSGESTRSIHGIPGYEVLGSVTKTSRLCVEKHTKRIIMRGCTNDEKRTV